MQPNKKPVDLEDELYMNIISWASLHKLSAESLLRILARVVAWVKERHEKEADS